MTHHSFDLAETDERQLRELIHTLAIADPQSPLANDLNRIKRRGGGLGRPLDETVAIRWAIQFALERFPLDDLLAEEPP
jgi:hypothetical protein